MDTKQLKTFITVSKLLNFRATAEELNYSQSTVSDHIRSLEIDLNAKLFDRIGKKVFLTDCGQKLIPAAQKMLIDEQEMFNLFNSSESLTDSLTIGISETLCLSYLPKLLKEYSRLYPKVRLNIKMADCIDFYEMIQKNTIDMAFSLSFDLRKDFTGIKLFEKPAVVVASPNHPLASLSKISVNDLNNQSFILIESDTCGYSYYFKKLLKENNIHAESILELNSIGAIKECIKNELGIALLPSIVVDKEISRGELAALPIDTDIKIATYILYHNDKWLSPALKALISTAESEFQ